MAPGPVTSVVVGYRENCVMKGEIQLAPDRHSVRGRVPRYERSILRRVGQEELGWRIFPVPLKLPAATM